MTSNEGRLPLQFGTPAGNESLEKALATARAAEDAGMTYVSMSDRPGQPMLEGWTLGTALLVRSERIRLFHNTLNVPFRYPSVLAKEAATLDLLSGGRYVVCLGAGYERSSAWYEAMGVPFGSPGERVQDVRDAIHILRGIWQGDSFSYNGRIYSADGVSSEPRPSAGMMPIWVGALAPRMLRLTSELADGFLKNLGWAPLEEMQRLQGTVSLAALAAGRDPHSIRRVVNAGAYVARDEADARAYRERVGPNVGGLIGTVEEILETIRQYRAAGVDTFNLVTRPEGDIEQIRRFGAEVIPEAAPF